MLSLVALTLALGRADYRSQYPFPSLTVPSGWGVNIHFADPEPGEVERIAAAGFRWVRMDFTWSSIERRRGEYDFSHYDRLMSALRANRIRPLFILDYGNDLYESDSPRSPEARQAFARFVSAGIRHFRHQGVIWELWNEPNIEFWKPQPNVDEYIALADLVGRTIRSQTPDEWYVGPATSGFDWDFLTRCFRAGLLRYWDAVSVHPYRDTPPETVATDWYRLRNLIAAEGNGRRLPMISGEWGYSDIRTGRGQQAQFVIRQYLANLQSGVPISIYYDWRDDGTNPTDKEHHFGTVENGMAPKAAFNAIRHLNLKLAGYTYAGRVTTPGNVRLLLFKKGSLTKYVAYTIDGGRSTVRIPSGGAFTTSSPSAHGTLPKGAAARGVTVTPEPKVFTPGG